MAAAADDVLVVYSALAVVDIPQSAAPAAVAVWNIPVVAVVETAEVVETFDEASALGVDGNP